MVWLLSLEVITPHFGMIRSVLVNVLRRDYLVEEMPVFAITTNHIMVPKVTDRDEVAVPKVLKLIIKMTSAELHKAIYL